MSMIELRDAVVFAETLVKLSTLEVIWLMVAPKAARWVLTKPMAVSRVAMPVIAVVDVPTDSVLMDRPEAVMIVVKVAVMVWLAAAPA